MAFYYVKNGGTATGDAGRYASQQTGSFASLGAAGYYDNIRAAMDATTTPTSADQISTSDIHSHAYSANTIYNGPTSGLFVNIVSVSDTAINSYSIGADESASEGFDLTFAGRLSFHGVSLLAGDDIQLIANNINLYIYDGSIGVNGTNDVFRIAGDGASMVLVNSVLMCNGTSASVDLSNGSYLKMIGGSVSTGDRFLFSNWDSGGAKVDLIGVDLSQVATYILRFVGGSSTNDDLVDINMLGCQINGTSPGFVEESFTNLSHKFSAFNCSSVSSESEYQFFTRTMQGDAVDQDSTGIHRNESTAFNGGEKVSIKVTTTTNASKFNPMMFDLPARFMALSSASTDTARIYFAVSNAVTLTDSNCWAELIYPDGTSKQIYNLVSNRNSDILAAGTAHTDDSGSSTWMSGGSALTAHNEYRMDINTSSDVGSDGVPILRVYLSEQSIDVYFDTSVDVVA